MLNRQAMRADLVLLLTACLWGVAFVPQRVAMRHMGPLTYNGLRFTLGAAVLGAGILIRRRQVQTAMPARAENAPTSVLPAVPRGWRAYLAAGALAGAVLFVGAYLQQAGLAHTSAAKGGFITGLYVPLVPVLGLLVGLRTRWPTWAGITLALAGLYLLSFSAATGAAGSSASSVFKTTLAHSSTGFTIWIAPTALPKGDALVLAGAVAWAIHVLLIGRLAPRLDPLQLGMAQFAVVGCASLIAAVAVREPIDVLDLRAGAWTILYGGLASVGVGYTLQIVGQRYAPAGHAALMLSLEAVFAALAGWLALHEGFFGRGRCWGPD